MSYVISIHRDPDEDGTMFWSVTIDTIDGGKRTTIRRSRPYPTFREAEGCAEGMRWGLKCITEEPVTWDTRFQ